MKQAALKIGDKRPLLRAYKNRRGEVVYPQNTPCVVRGLDNAPLINVEVLLPNGDRKITLIPESYIVEP